MSDRYDHRHLTDTVPPAEEMDEIVLSPPLRELGGRLAGLSLPSQVFTLAMWPFLEQLLNLMVSTVDMALAGRLGDHAMTRAASSALATGTIVGWFMGIVQSSLGVGAAALIGRAIGGRHRGLARAAVGQAMLIALVSGLLMCAAVFTVARFMPALVHLEGDGAPLCVTYLRVLAFAGPFGALLLISNACLRAAGDTRTPFLVMVVVNIVNTGSSVLFVYGPGAIGGHGVAGIAAGTVLAWIVGAAMVIGAMLTGRNGARLKLYVHRMRPHWHTLRRMIRVALPSLVEAVGGMWLASMIVMTMVGRLPGDADVLLAAHIIAIRVEAFSFQPGFALSTAASTLVAQYLGLGDVQRARRAGWLCARYAMTIMGAMGILFLIFPGAFVYVFTDEPDLVAQAMPLIRICGAIQVFFASYMVCAGALRGAGDTRTTMAMTYTSVVVFRISGAYLLGPVLGLGLPGIWLALCADLTFKGILFTTRYLHGGWTKINV